MAIFLTADLHLGHEKVSGLRGFNSVLEHDLHIISMWNHTVLPNDIVYVLGDVLMGDRDRGRRLLKQLHGTLHLILGNHDRPAPNNKNGHLHQDSMGTVWASMSTIAEISHQGTAWIMSHYPYSGDHSSEERFDQWRPRDLGKPLFHGHTHSSEKLSVSSYGSPQVHVGLDAWGLKPVSLGTAAALYSTK